MDVYEKLQELIEWGEIELLIEDNKCFLVYLMNDALESYFAFEDAVLTGEYDKDYDGPVQAFLECEEKRKVLVVRQGNENAFTISFSDVKLEVKCYNYGQIGHFWIPKYEWLRRIEFILAIVRDKYRFLGEEYVNEKEKTLACLSGFSPWMSYYPSVPERYRVEVEIELEQKRAAAEKMLEIAREIGDVIFEKSVVKYLCFMTGRRERKLAQLLQKKKHQGIVSYIEKLIKEAASEYPYREFAHNQNEYEQMRQMGKQCVDEFVEKGINAKLFYEEPFVLGEMDVPFRVFVMLERVILGKCHVKIMYVGKSHK